MFFSSLTDSWIPCTVNHFHLFLSCEILWIIAFLCQIIFFVVDRIITSFLKGHCHTIGDFTKSWKVPLHQLNSKTNYLVLLLKTIWRYWNCSQSPVTTNGMDGSDWNFEIYQVLIPRVPKILEKFIMVSPLW